MPLLTNARHERFAQLIAQLHSATSAYKIAFDCKESSAKANAGRLMTNDDVLARIAELQKASATEAVMTMQERRRIGAGIARDDRQRASDRIAAIACDAKLAGEWADRQEHSGQIASNITLPLSLLTAIREQRQRVISAGANAPTMPAKAPELAKREAKC